MKKRTTSSKDTDDLLYDYKSFRNQPKSGLYSPENHQFYTVSLFLETCPKGKEDMIKWTLDEVERPHPVTGKMLPSAWQVYMHAENEYVAMRRLVGSAKQWDALCQLDWFKRHLDTWKADVFMMQKSMVHDALIGLVKEGGAGAVSASKVLLSEFGVSMEPKQGRGRPTNKAAETYEAVKKEVEDGAVNSDFNRIMDFKRRVDNS